MNVTLVIVMRPSQTIECMGIEVFMGIFICNKTNEPKCLDITTR